MASEMVRASLASALMRCVSARLCSMSALYTTSLAAAGGGARFMRSSMACAARSCSSSLPAGLAGEDSSAASSEPDSPELLAARACLLPTFCGGRLMRRETGRRDTYMACLFVLLYSLHSE